MSLLKTDFAGSFYANNQVTLRKQLDNFFKNTNKVIDQPRALIVPHAGYVYSGQTAAHGYKQLENENIETIIILSPAHKTFHKSLALPNETILETPFGNLYVDMEKSKQLTDSGTFSFNSAPHYGEHSSEVQLPFIKTMSPDCKVVPVNVGMIDVDTANAAAKEIAKIIDYKTIVIVSNDLSHYHPLNIAKEIDNRTIEKILKLSPEELLLAYQNKTIECCGIFPITVLLSTLKLLNINKSKILNYDTSASSSFDDQHVVGYVSIGFY